MNAMEKQWAPESISEALKSKERKTELVRKLSGSIVIAAPALYRMDLSRFPAYFHEKSLTSGYSKEELLGAVKST